ncbi:MAG: alpha/beta hydrolase [Synechococcales cyanobacterium M58_A2018_015]|nr:alpha/beta hydrolase [Synechococcales cyanobacterium M58_A2018_015]
MTRTLSCCSGWQARKAALRNWGSSLLLAAAAVVLPLAGRAAAADRIYFTYGPLSRSFSIEDLRTFAETGETTRQLRWYLNFTNADPDAVRQVLTQNVRLNPVFVDQITYSLPGEFVLFQMGRVVHTKSRQGAVQIRALRSAFILSAADDNQISLLEFLEKYPTPEVFVDGVVLARAARNVQGFIAQIEPTIAVIQEFLANFVCDECEVPRLRPR